MIDGDTVEVLLEDGSGDTVRLLGVDTPETLGENKPQEYGDITDTACLTDWGRNATKFASRLLLGETVQLVFDSMAGERGAFGRRLAYMEGEYLALERQAQAQYVGLWRCSGGSPVPTVPSSAGGLRYDPFGPHRNSSDFSTWSESQNFYLSAGGPGVDPHRLDGDKDGVACESLPGAP